ncbi:hypothetical protein B7494_g28 [Chlorociboria aeruginascens]|nr:hypothetical protein B7494_g28 [Chlorociboria aeruginascens]
MDLSDGGHDVGRRRRMRRGRRSPMVLGLWQRADGEEEKILLEAHPEEPRPLARLDPRAAKQTKGAEMGPEAHTPALPVTVTVEEHRVARAERIPTRRLSLLLTPVDVRCPRISVAQRPRPATHPPNGVRRRHGDVVANPARQPGTRPSSSVPRHITVCDAPRDTSYYPDTGQGKPAPRSRLEQFLPTYLLPPSLPPYLSIKPQHLCPLPSIMTLLRSLHLEHLPLDHTIHIALFRNVNNASFLHQQLLGGNREFEYAFIDASVLVSTRQALSATYRATYDLLAARLRSRNVHSEIVFSLSPNNNIAESFRRFGISPTTTNLLIVKVSTPSSPFAAQAVQEHLSGVVEGEQVAFEDEILGGMTDVQRVTKVYKLGAGGKKGEVIAGGDGDGDGTRAVRERKELEILVLGCMALRGAMN